MLFYFKSSPDVLMCCPGWEPMNFPFVEEEHEGQIEVASSPRSHGRDWLPCLQSQLGVCSTRPRGALFCVPIIPRSPESLLKLAVAVFLLSCLCPSPPGNRASVHLLQEADHPSSSDLSEYGPSKALLLRVWPEDQLHQCHLGGC